MVGGTLALQPYQRQGPPSWGTSQARWGAPRPLRETRVFLPGVGAVTGPRGCAPATAGKLRGLCSQQFPCTQAQAESPPAGSAGRYLRGAEPGAGPSHTAWGRRPFLWRYAQKRAGRHRGSSGRWGKCRVSLPRVPWAQSAGSGPFAPCAPELEAASAGGGVEAGAGGGAAGGGGILAAQLAAEARPRLSARLCGSSSKRPAGCVHHVVPGGVQVRRRAACAAGTRPRPHERRGAGGGLGGSARWPPLSPTASRSA